MAKIADGAGQEHDQGESTASQLIKLSMFVAATGALFYGVLSLVQPQYKSVAQIEVSQRGTPSTRLVASQLKALRQKQMASGFIENYRLADDPDFNVLLAPQGPLKRVSIMLGLSDDPVKLAKAQRVLAAFNERVTFDTGQKSRIIEIGVRSTNALKSARIANRYARTYIASLESAASPKVRPVRPRREPVLMSSLRTKIASNKAELAALREDIRTNPFVPPVLFEESIVKPATDELALADVELSKEQLFELTSKYILARADREQAELRAKLVRDMLESSGEIQGTSSVLNSGEVQRLLIKRSRMERKQADLEAALLPAHPQLKRINREMVELQWQIKSEARKALENLENEAKVSAVREKSLKESLDKLQGKAAPLVDVVNEVDVVNDVKTSTIAKPVKTDDRLARLGVLQRSIADTKQILVTATARFAAKSQEPAVQVRAPITATIKSKAVADSVPVFPKKTPITLLGMLAAFGLGVLMLMVAPKPRRNEPREPEIQPSKPAPKTVDDDLLGYGQNPPVEFGTRPVGV